MRILLIVMEIVYVQNFRPSAKLLVILLGVACAQDVLAPMCTLDSRETVHSTYCTCRLSVAVVGFVRNSRLLCSIQNLPASIRSNTVKAADEPTTQT